MYGIVTSTDRLLKEEDEMQKGEAISAKAFFFELGEATNINR
jgi:hypothetical protein